jgi:hypothetical protein
LPDVSGFNIPKWEKIYLMPTKYKYQVVRKCTKWPEKNSEIFYLKAYVICKNTQISVLLSKYVYLLATLLMYEVAFKNFLRVNSHSNR